MLSAAEFFVVALRISQVSTQYHKIPKPDRGVCDGPQGTGGWVHAGAFPCFGVPEGFSSFFL